MPEHKHKKAIFVCRVAAVLSLVVVLAIVIITVNIENWNDTISMTLRVLSQVSWACFLFSILGIVIFKQKGKAQKTDDKIKELEQEIERLKNK